MYKRQVVARLRLTLPLTTSMLTSIMLRAYVIWQSNSVDEGLFGDVPPQFQFYIDYDAIARDLSFDYTETEIAGERLIYRIS